MEIKKVIKYFIAYYGASGCRWWDGEMKRWVPNGMCLYRTSYDTVEDAMKELRIVRKKSSGWYDDIYIDSYLTVA